MNLVRKIAFTLYNNVDIHCRNFSPKMRETETDEDRVKGGREKKIVTEYNDN